MQFLTLIAGRNAIFVVLTTRILRLRLQISSFSIYLASLNNSTPKMLWILVISCLQADMLELPIWRPPSLNYGFRLRSVDSISVSSLMQNMMLISWSSILIIYGWSHMRKYPNYRSTSGFDTPHWQNGWHVLPERSAQPELGNVTKTSQSTAHRLEMAR